MPGACVMRGNSALQLPGCVPCISTLASLRPSPLISLNGGVARMSHGPRGDGALGVLCLLLSPLDSSWGGEGLTQSPYLWGLVKSPAGDEGGKDTCILHFLAPAKLRGPTSTPSIQSKHQWLFPDAPAQGQDTCQSTQPLR